MQVLKFQCRLPSDVSDSLRSGLDTHHNIPGLLAEISFWPVASNEVGGDASNPMRKSGFGNQDPMRHSFIRGIWAITAVHSTRYRGVERLGVEAKIRFRSVGWNRWRVILNWCEQGNALIEPSYGADHFRKARLFINDR
jgi:hypothetical protein